MKLSLLLVSCMLVTISAELPSGTEIKEIMDAHNKYRRSAGASNMEHMVRECRQIMIINKS